MVHDISIVILGSYTVVWFKGIGVIIMRKEDEQAIKRALAILRVECQEHRSCCSCKFYSDNGSETTSKDCLLNVPPMHYNLEEIIKCFT